MNIFISDNERTVHVHVYSTVDVWYILCMYMSNKSIDRLVLKGIFTYDGQNDCTSRRLLCFGVRPLSGNPYPSAKVELAPQSTVGRILKFFNFIVAFTKNGKQMILICCHYPE